MIYEYLIFIGANETFGVNNAESSVIEFEPFITIDHPMNDGSTEYADQYLLSSNNSGKASDFTIIEAPVLVEDKYQITVPTNLKLETEFYIMGSTTMVESGETGLYSWNYYYGYSGIVKISVVCGREIVLSNLTEYDIGVFPPLELGSPMVELPIAINITSSSPDCPLIEL